MSGYLQWVILSMLTGSPLGSLALLVAVWFLVDRIAFGVLPDPIRWVVRRRREHSLRSQLRGAPHDRRAQLELAHLLLERKCWRQAMELLRPTLETGDDDIGTVFAMGAACLGAGSFEAGEKLLEVVRERDADFRVGEIDLLLGRSFLARGDLAKAKEAFERLLAIRKGSVEGRVLLAHTVARLGDRARASELRDTAWHEYVTSPRFQRRKERWWAWRAKPIRPLLWASVVVVTMWLIVHSLGPGLLQWATAPELPPM